MAVYEYKCRNCGSIIEINRKPTDKEPETIECPECGPITRIFDKLISKSTFILKFDTNY